VIRGLTAPAPVRRISDTPADQLALV
jgi:hypothetical protein